MPSTLGFANDRQLLRHYAEHGKDFGASNAKDYERMAREFLEEPIGSIRECIRSGGDIVRFDPATDRFGVVGCDGVIRTFFKPIPCASIAGPYRMLLKTMGRCHQHADNAKYFIEECKRW